MSWLRESEREKFDFTIQKNIMKKITVNAILKEAAFK